MSVIYINSYQFASAPPVGPTDPDFASVSLLLHGDGADGSTTIVDSSPSPKAVTAVGNAQISTAQSKFGGASIAFDGNGDHLRIPTSSDLAFGTNDFTVEMWLYRTVSGQQHLYEGRRASVTGRLLIYLDASTQLTVYANGGVVISSSTVPSVNNWVHIAFCRSTGVSRLFADGIQVGSSYSDSINYLAPTDFLVIGANDVTTGSYLNGYIDDLRITKGVARYTSNFTPPTAPFPDA